MDPKNLDFKGFFNSQIADKSIVVINKSDLGFDNSAKLEKNMDSIIISVKLGKNVDKLIDNIKSKLKKHFLNNDNVIITRSRHRHHLKECHKHLNNFFVKNDNEDYDKAAEDLRLSIRHIGTIVGKVDVEEILGIYF